MRVGPRGWSTRHCGSKAPMPTRRRFDRECSAQPRGTGRASDITETGCSKGIGREAHLYPSNGDPGTDNQPERTRLLYEPGVAVPSTRRRKP